jgi:hypothetical protein
MDENNENQNPIANAESPAQTQRSPDNFGAQTPACGAECVCHTAAPASRIRWIVGAVILVAVAALAVRAVTKNNGGPASASADGFTNNLTANQAPGSLAQGGNEIGAFSDLNNAVTDTDAVFIFLPDKNGSAKPPTTQMQSAVQTLKAKGIKIGLFTLRTDSPDYVSISSQMPVPGVIVAVKGRGMVPVSGDVIETKLIQALVAASNTGGGCGPSGCGPSDPSCK